MFSQLNGRLINVFPAELSVEITHPSSALSVQTIQVLVGFSVAEGFILNSLNQIFTAPSPLLI
jgi:hypothetical protein